MRADRGAAFQSISKLLIRERAGAERVDCFLLVGAASSFCHATMVAPPPSSRRYTSARMNGFAILAGWCVIGAIALFFRLTTSTSRFHLSHMLAAWLGLGIGIATVYEIARWVIGQP